MDTSSMINTALGWTGIPECKQKQLLMNISVLSSLNKKPVPQMKSDERIGLDSHFPSKSHWFPVISPSSFFPSSQPQPRHHNTFMLYQPQTLFIQPSHLLNHKAVSQMSFQSNQSGGSNSAFSNGYDDYVQTQMMTTDSYYLTSFNPHFNNPLYLAESQHKAYTSSYYAIPTIEANRSEYTHQLYTQQYFPVQNTASSRGTETTLLGKKISKNKIIINDDILDNPQKKDEKAKDPKKKRKIFKHHSAPVKPLNLTKFTTTLETYPETTKEAPWNTDDKTNPFKCPHNCDLSYKTKKLLLAHHNKMDIECQKDTLHLLKWINHTKQIVLFLKHNDDPNHVLEGSAYSKLSEKYERWMKEIPMTEYATTICGETFDTIVNNESM